MSRFNTLYTSVIVLLLSSFHAIAASAVTIELNASFNARGTKLGIATLTTNESNNCRVSLYGSLSRTEVLNKTAAALLASSDSERLFEVSRLKAFPSSIRRPRKLFLSATVLCNDNATDSDLIAVSLVHASTGKATKSTFTSRLHSNFTTKTLTLTEAFPGLTFSDPLGFEVQPGTNNIYIIEQGGLVYRVNNGQKELFLDISDIIQRSDEQGLLGLAFHPSFKQNHLMYVHYSAKGTGDTVIARYQVKSGVVDESTAQIVFGTPQPFSNHNGGQIGFGKDGFLYIALGDGGSGGDPQGNGQNLTTYLGKILRIDVDRHPNGAAYAIPNNNPFKNNSSGYKEEIFAYGLRNPWRFSFDTKGGTLWAADVGQGDYEEIDIIQRGGNYGWNTMEGFHCYSPSSGCNQSGLTLPVTEYDHSQGNRSVTGGFVYRGTVNLALNGLYVFGDFSSGRIYAVRASAPSAAPAELLNSSELISSFGRDKKGEIYLISYGSGKIYKLGL